VTLQLAGLHVQLDGVGIVRAWDVRGTLGYRELLRALGSDPWELCENDVVRLKGDCDER
jgi:hypothetical protein